MIIRLGLPDGTKFLMVVPKTPDCRPGQIDNIYGISSGINNINSHNHDLIVALNGNPG